MRSPLNCEFFHAPTSSCWSSAQVRSAILRATPEMRFASASWKTTRRPSFESQRSSSIASAFCSQASFIAASVFSGASNEAPRWAMISTEKTLCAKQSAKRMSRSMEGLKRLARGFDKFGVCD